MASKNPLRGMQEQAEASFMPYGPDHHGIKVVESFGSYEAEYAAIRKGVGIFQMPHRGLVQVRGSDRTDFLHRLISHDTLTLQPGQGRRAFLLNTKGRITADLILLQGTDQIWADLDVFGAFDFVSELEEYVFTEDVAASNESSQFAHVALHGPASAKLIEAVTEVGISPVAQLGPFAHTTVTLCEQQCLVYRRDETGRLGLHVLIPVDGALAVYEKFATAVGGLVPNVDAVDGPGPKRDIMGRGVGWLAYNTARIEAGTPIYHIDFGPDTLPHETGVLDEAVSFTKGCYRGQEIVARMQNLGHPKRLLVGLKFHDDRMPIAGAQLFTEADSQDVIGAVTSSTTSPMLGGQAIALAMIKWGTHKPGTCVTVLAEGTRVPSTVQKLGFLGDPAFAAVTRPAIDSRPHPR